MRGLVGREEASGLAMHSQRLPHQLPACYQPLVPNLLEANRPPTPSPFLTGSACGQGGSKLPQASPVPSSPR